MAKAANTGGRPNSGKSTSDGPGRDTKLSPELREKFIGFIARGSYRETACAGCGIRPDTFRNWLKRGHKGEEPYATFLRDLEAAESSVEDETLGRLLKSGDWKADAWYLARKFPQRWAEKSFADVAVTQKGTAKTEINIIGPGGIVPDIAKKKRSHDS